MADRFGWISIAVAVLVGNLLVQQLPVLPPLWLSALAGLVALPCVRSRRWRLAGWFVMSGALAAWHGERAMQARLPVAMEGADIVVVGQLASLPQQNAGSTGFLFRIDDDGGRGFAPATVRLNWYGGVPPVACSRWRLTVRLKRPRSLLNPGSVDTERSALVRGIAATGYVRAGPQKPQRLATPSCIDGWREAVARRIDERVGGAHVGRLLKALAVGDTRSLDNDDWRVARVTGVAHLISISGLHIGIAALFGVAMASMVWRLWPVLGQTVPRAIGLALGALLAAAPYCLLAGAALPTVRSLLMVAVVALARTLRRSVSSTQVVAMALVVVLLLDPLASLAPAFWLSFVAVALLVAMLASDGRGLRAFASQLLRTQMLMTIGLMPLTLAFFGQASMVGALANLMAAPFVSLVVVPLTLVGALLLYPLPFLATPVLRVAAALLEGQWGWLERMAGWPWAQWSTAAPGTASVCIAMLGAIWLLMPRGWPLRWLGLVCMLPMVSAGMRPPAPGELRLWVLDVGQGLAVVVQTHTRTLLYDAGARFRSGFDLGAAQVVPALHALSTRQLDAIIVSHGDNDHAGGVPSVVAAFPEARIFGDENPHEGLAMEACGERHWQWDGIVFSTFPADAAAEGNDRSCVLLVEHPAGRVLIPGDASARTERAMVERVGPGAPLTLVVGHHGSRSSTSPVLVDALAPVLALVSAGWRSRFGHPHPDVVKRLEQAGADVLNSAGRGAIRVDWAPTGHSPRARGWRTQQAAYWRER